MKKNNKKSDNSHGSCRPENIYVILDEILFINTNRVLEIFGEFTLFFYLTYNSPIKTLREMTIR